MDLERILTENEARHVTVRHMYHTTLPGSKEVIDFIVITPGPGSCQVHFRYPAMAKPSFLVTLSDRPGNNWTLVVREGAIHYMPSSDRGLITALRAAHRFRLYESPRLEPRAQRVLVSA